VVSDCFEPVLTDASAHGLKHFVTAITYGHYPRFDRLDEDPHTPFYEAIANAAFGLAQSLLNKGATYQIDEWSLLHNSLKGAGHLYLNKVSSCVTV
jgi:hypothetical protein